MFFKKFNEKVPLIPEEVEIIKPGHPEWNTLFDTPPFPDFPSGHSTIVGSFGEILKGFFGNNYHFTNHAYDYLCMAPRSYNSFDELAKEIGDSRVYAGIHYRYSCEKGCEQGRLGLHFTNKEIVTIIDSLS